MNKIAVIGCGGAGKSMLSLELAKLFSLPVYHLDRIYWKSGWIPAEREDFIKAQNEIFATDSWIIDGNYGSVMDARLEEADTIIFLDVPTSTCLRGVVSRYFKYRKSSRPDMTDGNKERLTLEFLRYVCSYRRKKRPGIMKRLEYHKEKEIVILGSRSEIVGFLKSIANKRIQEDTATLSR